MVKKFKILVNNRQSENKEQFDIEPGANQPVRIKAKAGVRYVLQEVGKGDGLAPENIKVKRVGKNLHILFEDSDHADVIIEDYYSVMPEGFNAIIGQAENGSYYEYTPEDPTESGLIPVLGENAEVWQALGGSEVADAGAALAVAAFNPLLAALGAAGAAGAAAAGAGGGGAVATTTVLSINPVTADNVINQSEKTGNISITGKVTGTFAAGDKVALTVNGKPYTGQLLADGSFSIAVPADELVADDNKQFEATVTATGGTTATATHSYTVASTVTTLTIDAITGDDFITANEQTGTATITGSVTGEFKAGDIVTVTVGGTDYTGTVDAAGKYSIAGVDGGKFATDTDKAVAASILATDSANNTATITAAPRAYTLDSKTDAGKTALMLNPVTGDNIIDTTEGAATQTTLTGKATGAFAAGDVVTISVGLPGSVKTYSTTVDAAGAYTIAVDTADLKADTDTRVEARIEATVPGSAAKQTAIAAQDYVVENGNTVGKLTAISIDPVTADNIINAAENTGSIAITGKVTGAFASGDTVTLMVKGAPVTGSVNAQGVFSINVPAADLVADSDTQIEASVTGTGGTAASALQNYAVDTTPPSPGSTTLTIDAITGDDFITANEQTGTATITGSVTGEFKAGDIVTVTVGGTDYTGTVDAAGKYSIAGVDGGKFATDTDKAVAASILATDSANNTATITAAPRAYTLDSKTDAGKTALMLNPVTGDNIIDTTEGAATQTTLTGKATGAFAAGDVVTISVGLPGSVKTYSTTVDAAGAYTIAVDTADLKADTDTRVEARIEATVPGSAAKQTAIAAQDYVVENGNTVGKLTAISIDPVTADNIINAAENTGSIAITGKVTGAFASGDTVTLMVKGAPVTGSVNAQGVFSINVPAADLVADSDTQIEASVTGTGGTAASALQNYAVDTVGPTPPDIFNVQLMDNVDPQQGVVTTTNFTNDVRPELRGEATSDVAFVKVYSGPVNALTLIATVAVVNGKWSYTPDVDLDAGNPYKSYTWRVTPVDGANNEGDFAAAVEFKLDTLAPTVFPDLVAYADNVDPVSNTDSTAPVTNDPKLQIKIAKDAGHTSVTLDGTPTLLIDGVAVEGVIYDGKGTFTLPQALQDGKHQFSYRLTDAAGNVSRSTSNIMTVTIDTGKPVFTSNTTAAVDENIAAQSVVYTAAATDASNLTYTLKSGVGDVGKFSIDAMTGQVTLMDSPDFETKSSYDFTVVATDLAGNTTERAVKLAVNDLPEGLGLKLFADTGTLNNDRITSDATILVTGLAEGATWEYKVDNGAWNAGQGNSFEGESGKHTYALRQIVNSTATDALNPLDVTVDTTAPGKVFDGTNGAIPLPMVHGAPLAYYYNTVGYYKNGVPMFIELPTGSAVGDEINVAYVGTSFTTSHTVTADDLTAGKWSFAVDQSYYLSGVQPKFVATVKDLAGNVSDIGSALSPAPTLIPFYDIPDDKDLLKSIGGTVEGGTVDTGRSQMNNGDNFTIDSTLHFEGRAQPGSEVRIYDTFNGQTQAIGVANLESTIVSGSSTWRFDTGTCGLGDHVLTAVSVTKDSQGKDVLSDQSVKFVFTIQQQVPMLDLGQFMDGGTHIDTTYVNDIAERIVLDLNDFWNYDSVLTIESTGKQDTVILKNFNLATINETNHTKVHADGYWQYDLNETGTFNLLISDQMHAIYVQ